MIANMESGRRDIRMSDFLMISKAPNIPLSDCHVLP